MPLQLQHGVGHGQALARSLGVPDQPATVLPIADPFDDAVHRPVLLIAAQLLHRALVTGLEDGEVGQQIQDPPGVQHAEQVLIQRRREVCAAAWRGILPDAPVLAGGTGGPVAGRHTVGDDAEQAWREQARDVPLVLLDLLEGFAGLVVPGHRRLALNHYQGDAVAEDHQIRFAAALRLDVELTGHHPVVAPNRVGEVDQADGLARPASGHVAAIGATLQRQPPLVVGLAGQVRVHQPSDLGINAVESLHRRHQPLGQQHGVEGFAFGQVLCRRQHGVAQGA